MPVRTIKRTSKEKMSLKQNCTLGPQNKPVATVAPGETVEIETWDARGGILVAGQTPADVAQRGISGYENPITGPVYVEGAEPGDVLKIEIIDVKLPETAWTAIIPGFGGLEGWLQLSPPITKFSKISHSKIAYELKDGRTLEIPAEPFIGTIGVSPELEAISTIVPGKHGGNMDVPDVCEGNTLYLPVAVDGALFGIGDVHAVQGDGEICGTAAEVAAAVTLRFGLQKNKKLEWPRIESKDEIMAVCSAKPLEDAVRLAFLELVRWLESDYGFERYDAYMFLSLTAKLRVAQIVDPLFTVVAKLPKNLLPEKKPK